jgi:hypothetical protein
MHLHSLQDLNVRAGFDEARTPGAATKPGRAINASLLRATTFQLTLALQGGAERLTFLDVNQRHRQARAGISRLSRVVHPNPRVRIQ